MFLIFEIVGRKSFKASINGRKIKGRNIKNMGTNCMRTF